ncbi:unnamed protein product [marine sediment metagenome]|uniref:Uncharacterized protein n=1 Tax=marine sediment metagenome TaxID=412755 RepID=X1VEW3_9ZZZZ
MIKKLTPIVAIIAIAGLEFYALSQGVNGVALAGVIAVIAGLAGYGVKAISKP